MSGIRQQILNLCRDVIGPLLAVDGGVLYIVSVEDDLLTVHLAGTCAGCPGAPITTRFIIEPAVRSVSPSIKLTVTAGAAIPKGALPVEEFVAAP
ncbi:MAG: NifU family protein [Deltaproteobacteria bacterium]|nr:NifU family protein [Deltaproteobacteria bacterium]